MIDLNNVIVFIYKTPPGIHQEYVGQWKVLVGGGILTLHPPLTSKVSRRRTSKSFMIIKINIDEEF